MAMLAVTQSGETADTLAAVRFAREMDLLTLGMVRMKCHRMIKETGRIVGCQRCFFIQCRQPGFCISVIPDLFPDPMLYHRQDPVR
jgi:hypothetical protein